ncbi:MAG: hypothetical protein Q9210_000504 [Variospora velana]
MENEDEKYEYQTMKRVLEILEPGNEALSNLLEDYLSIDAILMPSMCCFYEQKPSDVWKIADEKNKKKDTLVPRSCATLDRIPSLAVATDHFNLNKFDDQKLNDYQTLLGKIEGFLEAKSYQAYLQRRVEMRKRNYSLLPIQMQHELARSALSPDMGRPPEQISHCTCEETTVIDYNGQKNQIEKVNVETFGWCFQDPRFTQWLDGKQSDIFLVAVGPHYDKSMMSRQLIDNVLEPMHCKTAYFFLRRYGDAGQDSLATAFSERKMPFRQILSEMWSLLERILDHWTAGPLFLVLDGLDEARVRERREFLDELKTFYAQRSQNHDNPNPVKLFITIGIFSSIEHEFLGPTDEE